MTVTESVATIVHEYLKLYPAHGTGFVIICPDEKMLVDALTGYVEKLVGESQCKRAHIPNCSYCQRPQTELGGLRFFISPSDESGHITGFKQHICKSCQLLIA